MLTNREFSQGVENFDLKKNIDKPVFRYLYAHLPKKVSRITSLGYFTTTSSVLVNVKLDKLKYNSLK